MFGPVSMHCKAVQTMAEMVADTLFEKHGKAQVQIKACLEYQIKKTAIYLGSNLAMCTEVVEISMGRVGTASFYILYTTDTQRAQLTDVPCTKTIAIPMKRNILPCCIL